tara:strand:- start:569 stop:901 length:333 start_codon:yes stop_codon:yes gene_type:complete
MFSTIKTSYKMTKANNGMIGLIEYGTYTKRVKMQACKNPKTKQESFVITSENKETRKHYTEATVLMTWQELQDRINGKAQGCFRVVFAKSTNYLEFKSINNMMKYFHSKV